MVAVVVVVVVVVWADNMYNTDPAGMDSNLFDAWPTSAGLKKTGTPTQRN